MTSVLCVLPPALLAHCAPELGWLEARGVQLVREPSPANAVTAAGVRRPQVIVVGLSMAEMEGLELVALIQQQHPDLGAPMVVLPDPGDPIDPLVCARDPATGCYGIEHFAREHIWARIAQLCGAVADGPAPILVPDVYEPTEPVVIAAAAAPPPAAPPAAPRPDAGPADLDAGPPDLDAAEWPEVAAEQSVPAVPARRGVSRLIVGAALALVGLAGVAAVLWLRLGGPAPARSPAAAAPAPRPAVPVATSRPAPAAPVAVARPAPAAPAAASAPTAAARADGDWLAPGSHPLPFAFARGQSAPAVTDEQSVAGLVAALAGGTRCGLTLLGHTCADGDQKLNGYLGRERARATRALLLGRGVRSGLLATASAGGKHAAGAHESEEDHARDRRVSLEVTCR